MSGATHRVFSRMFLLISLQKAAVEWLTLMLRIWEILGSISARSPSILTSAFRGFPQFLKTTAEIVP
jgi:hypothetical protein